MDMLQCALQEGAVTQIIRIKYNTPSQTSLAGENQEALAASGGVLVDLNNEDLTP